MSQDNFTWEVSTKSNTQKELIFTSPDLYKEQEKSKGPYGISSVIIAVLFVTMVLLIEKKEFAQRQSYKSSTSVEKTLLQSTYAQLSEKINDSLREYKAYEGAKLLDGNLVLSFNPDLVFYLVNKNSISVNGVSERMFTKLTKLLLNENRVYSIEVNSHTDGRSVSEKDYKMFSSNWELASAMSSKIAVRLIQAGYLGKNLQVNSFADTRPLYPNKNIAGEYISENLSKNRRIELVIK